MSQATLPMTDPLEGTTPTSEPIPGSKLPPITAPQEKAPPSPLNQEQFTTQAASEFARLMAREKIERPPIMVEDGRLAITDFSQAYRVANTIFAAGTYPESWVKREATKEGALAAITLCLMYGAENGFSLTQTMTCVYVVNGKPSLYGDGPIAKVYASGKLASIKETWEGEGDKLKCTVTIRRRERIDAPESDWSEPHTRSYSVQDSKDAGLGGPLWKNKGQHRRMVQCRARAWVLRDHFPDVLMGLLIKEEYDGTDLDPAASTGSTISSRLEAEASK